jgi:hypothetical protein
MNKRLEIILDRSTCWICKRKVKYWEKNYQYKTQIRIFYGPNWVNLNQ